MFHGVFCNSYGCRMMCFMFWWMIRAGRVRKASFVSLFTELEEEQAQKLIQALQMCQHRMEIDLYGAYLGEKGTDLLCDFLSDPKCVERLNIQKLRVNEEEFCKLWQSIGKNKSLKYLKVTAYPWDVLTIMGEADTCWDELLSLRSI